MAARTRTKAKPSVSGVPLMEDGRTHADKGGVR